MLYVVVMVAGVVLLCPHTRCGPLLQWQRVLASGVASDYELPVPPPEAQDRGQALSFPEDLCIINNKH